MLRYKNWIKNAETPDEKDFFIIPYDEKKKRKIALINLYFCFLFLLLQILAGLMNQSSSRTAWIFFPYILLFLPIAYFFFGATTFITVPKKNSVMTIDQETEHEQSCISLSRKEWEKSLARCKHSGFALLAISCINALLEFVYIVLHRNDGITKDFLYLAVLIVMAAMCALYGIFFDRSFSKPAGNSHE